ncbi:hypothetical protein CPB86DRAFT_182118 [Serendipita vermifera]|nr:hypothetical protein CPB86DRAFT_182118 [Serendipita vermifera]
MHDQSFQRARLSLRVYAFSCTIADEAHINATRVVSGRRFVRWDTVPKLLAQQNMYISGLPYDFFFSKSVLTLGRVPTGTSAIGNTGLVGSGGVRPQATGLGPTEASYNLANAGLAGNSGAIAAAADRDGERHSNRKSLLSHPHEEAAPVVVEEDELVDDNEEEEEEDVDGDDELDGSSSSNMDVTTPPSSGSPGASGATTVSRSGTTPASPPLSTMTAATTAPDFLLSPSGPGAVHNSPHHHRTHDYQQAPHGSKSIGNRFNPQQSNQPITSSSSSIPAVAGGVVTGVAAEAHIPISSLDAASIVAILHAQPLNINILSWKKQTIEEILALLRQGKIRVAPRPQGRDVVFELVMPNGNTVDVPKWPDVFPSAAAAMVMSNLSNTQSPNNNHHHHHHHHHNTERVTFPSSSSPALDGAFDASGNEGPPLRDGGGVIRTSRADREKRRGISAGPASSSAYERTRTMSGGGGGGPYGAPSSTNATSSASGAGGMALKLRMDGRAATPSSSGVASPDRESTFPYSQRGRRLTSIKGEGSEEQDGSCGDKMVHHYTLTPSSFHPYQPSMGKMQVVTSGERAMSDEMLSPSSGGGMMMAEDPPTRGRSTFPSAAAAAAAAGAFLTTPTPTKKWTRRSSPDRIYMNVTLNSILRGAGMPIPRQKDDASRLPWSSIPQFLAEKQLYITGWPEANLPWLYSGDEPKGANGNSPSKGGPKLPNGSMGEWKDRIDWKSSPSQRSYKPLAQALRNGEIKILARPKGRDVIFEVKDAQGRMYDTTLGLSEEWKRKWMYSGEKQQQALVYPSEERRGSYVSSVLVDMEEDSKAESMSVDEDVEQKRAVYRSSHPRRSFDLHHHEFSPERSTPSSFGRSSPVPSHTMRRMSYPFPPISSSYPSPYGQHGSYSRHGTESSYDGPSRYSSSSHGLDERYSLGAREYMESTARYQQPPESSLRETNDAPMREGRPDSAPKELEEEVTSPGSSRQRTASLGTSSAASGTVLSPGQLHTSNKMGYTLPPLSQSTAMDIDMDDPKVNKLPPIRALMYDSDDDRSRPLHSHHLTLPQLSASTTSLSSSGIPATPNNPYLSTTPPRSQLGYSSSSPRMSVDRRDPSPPETNNTNNIPTHLPKPTSAFSQPFWEPKDQVWRLNVQDSEGAALPPVGNKVCWDARSGKWRVACHTHLVDTNSGFAVAFWSPDKEAWILSSSA